MADQGFTKPNRNAAGWDSDVNANFTIIERGYLFARACGPAAIASGQLVTFNASGFAAVYDPFAALGPPDALAFNAASPGNTAYFLAWGAVSSFAPWSGQLPMTQGGRIAPSIRTPGWVTSCLDYGTMFDVGRVIDQGTYIFKPGARPAQFGSVVASGISHCASTNFGVFSFTMQVGANGFNTRLRVATLSCDNYRVAFFADSAKLNAIYDTTINSGNLSVRTIDMIDAALWAYSLDYSSSDMFGRIYGTIEVLSSAATAINCGAFSVEFQFTRHK